MVDAARGASPAGEGPPWGAVVGRFYPFHEGHRALMAFAALVCGGQRRAIVRVAAGDAGRKQAERVGWMLLEWARCSLPEGEERSPTQIDGLRRLMRVPDSGDRLLFSFEPVDALAEALGARVVRFDPGLGVEVSAIEQDPLRHWGLLAPRQRWGLRRHAVVLAHSPSARAALARRLADHYGAVVEPGASVVAGLRPDAVPTPQQIVEACSLGERKNRLISDHDPPLVISDDEPLSALFWSERAFGLYPVWAEGSVKEDTLQGRLFLVLDEPSIDDPTMPINRWVAQLEASSARYERLSGSQDEQLRQAVVAVDRLLGERPFARAGR